MNRIDIVKSLVRTAVSKVSDQLRRLDLPEPLGQALQDALMRRLALRDRQLTAAAACAPTVRAVTVSVKPGSIQVDASLLDGGELQASLVPMGAAFAPSGAKDLSFRVQPAEAAGQRPLCDVVGAIASELARSLWGPFLTRDVQRSHWAFVERDGDILRVDLRTVPEVRATLAVRPLALVIEALIVKEIIAEQGALRLTLGLPGMIR